MSITTRLYTREGFTLVLTSIEALALILIDTINISNTSSLISILFPALTNVYSIVLGSLSSTLIDFISINITYDLTISSNILRYIRNYI